MAEYKFEIIMVIDGVEYYYGADNDYKHAWDIAWRVSIERDCECFVRER